MCHCQFGVATQSSDEYSPRPERDGFGSSRGKGRMSELGGAVGNSEPPSIPSAHSPVTAGPGQRNELAIALRNGLRLGSSLLLTWAVALIVKLQLPAQLGPIRQGHFAFAESFAM